MTNNASTNIKLQTKFIIKLSNKIFVVANKAACLVAFINLLKKNPCVSVRRRHSV